MPILESRQPASPSLARSARPTELPFAAAGGHDLDTLRRLLEWLGLPFGLFAADGTPRELSVAARAIAATDAAGEQLWRQASRLAVRALDATPGAGGRATDGVTVGGYALAVRPVSAAGERLALVVLHPALGPRASGSPFDGFGLTPREHEVALLLAQGRCAKELARALAISTHTARRHTERIYVKLGVQSQTQIVLLAAGRPGAAAASVPRSA